MTKIRSMSSYLRAAGRGGEFDARAPFTAEDLRRGMAFEAPGAAATAVTSGSIYAVDADAVEYVKDGSSRVHVTTTERFLAMINRKGARLLALGVGPVPPAS